MKVIPLKYGVMFKRAFSQPDVFQQFAKDILDIEINIDKVHTEYEYPETVGFVRSKYDLFAEDIDKRIIVEIQQVKEGDFFDRFLYYHLVSMVEQVGGFKEYGFDRTVYTIVVLTSTPRDGSINFSCAISDMNPINEHGQTIDVYPHRLLFLCPRLTNKETPPKIKKWLDFIADSLDGEMDDNDYQETIWKKIIDTIKKKTIDPTLLSEIKDDMAWEESKKRFAKEGREEVRQQAQQTILKQQQTILQARKMGLDDNAIVQLTGLTPTKIKSVEKISEKD